MQLYQNSNSFHYVSTIYPFPFRLYLKRHIPNCSSIFINFIKIVLHLGAAQILRSRRSRLLRDCGQEQQDLRGTIFLQERA